MKQNKNLFSNFRTKQAQQIRDKMLISKSVGFLHQAFRFRGKANYREALYLSHINYITIESIEQFLSDIHIVGFDFFNISMSYIKARLPNNDILPKFFQDLSDNSMIAYIKEYSQRTL